MGKNNAWAGTSRGVDVPFGCGPAEGPQKAKTRMPLRGMSRRSCLSNTPALVGHPGTPHRIPRNAASLEEGFGKQLYRKPPGPNSIPLAVLRSPSTGRIFNPPRAQGARPVSAAVAGGGPGEPTPYNDYLRFSDEEILKNLLALNLERYEQGAAKNLVGGS